MKTITSKQIGEWLKFREGRLIQVARDCAEAGLENASAHAWEEVSKIQELQHELRTCLASVGCGATALVKIEGEIPIVRAQDPSVATMEAIDALRKIAQKAYKPITKFDYEVHPDLIADAKEALKRLDKANED